MKNEPAVEIFSVKHKGKVIQSVGNCPKCNNPVEYVGIGRLMKGTGFSGHKGICVSCKAEYHINEK